MRFVPFSPKQIKALLGSDMPYNLWSGSIRSGKTVLSIPWMIEKIQDLPMGYGMITGQTTETIERNFLNDFMEVLGEGNYHYVTGKYIDVYYRDKRNGDMKSRRLFIVGIKDKGAIRRIRGSTLVLLYMDEASLTPKVVFEELLGRLSVKGAKALFTTNPDSPKHFLMKDYVEDKEKMLDWSYHTFVLEDNLSLDIGYVERLKRQYKGIRVLYDRMIRGLWVMAEGRIYDCYDTEKHIIKEIPQGAIFMKYHVFGDFGIGNPTVYLLVGEYRYNGNRMYIVEDEYYYGANTNHGRKLTVAKLYEGFEKLLEKNKVNRVSSIILDPSASALITEFESNRRVITKAKNNVIEGIARTGNMLEDGRLYLLKGKAPMTEEEFELYVWDAVALEKGEDKPIKQNDHCLDALRYGMLTLEGSVGMIGGRK